MRPVLICTGFHILSISWYCIKALSVFYDFTVDFCDKIHISIRVFGTGTCASSDLYFVAWSKDILRGRLCTIQKNKLLPL